MRPTCRRRPRGPGQGAGGPGPGQGGRSPGPGGLDLPDLRGPGPAGGRGTGPWSDREESAAAVSPWGQGSGEEEVR
nr:MAG: hypothetical protein DIU70_07500 [Bacillota bacterium]